jgi:FkbM family methyltransferase
LGAFIGYYTVLFANRVGSKGKVIAFEPSPMSFKTLSKNVEAYDSKKRFDNISIEQKAVTEHSNEKVLLHLCNENYGMNRIYPSKYCGPKANKIGIETIIVDDYFQN